jgi:hypothetical protein
MLTHELLLQLEDRAAGSTGALIPQPPLWTRVRVLHTEEAVEPLVSEYMRAVYRVNPEHVGWVNSRGVGLVASHPGM